MASSPCRHAVSYNATFQAVLQQGTLATHLCTHCHFGVLTHACVTVPFVQQVRTFTGLCVTLTWAGLLSHTKAIARHFLINRLATWISKLRNF